MKVAVDEWMPVWKQPRGSYGSNFWEVYSPKLDRNVSRYSDLERDHWVLVEADPQIIRFCEQPVRIKIRIDGQDMRTIPDMVVRFRDGHDEYREVKYAHELARIAVDPRLARQLAGQRSWCAIGGYGHRLITDEVIRSNRLLLSNWKRVLAYLAPCQPDWTELQTNIMTMVEIKPAWRLAEIEQHFRPIDPGITRTVIFRLLHRGLLTAPLDTVTLSSELIIRRCDANILAT